MKIILLGPAHPLRGGIANFNEELAKALADAKHEVVLYSFALQYPNFLFPGKTQFEKGPAPQGLNIKTVVNSVNPFNWISSAFKIKNEKPDLLIVRFWLPFMGPCLGTICRIVKWTTGIRVIAITDNVIPHEKRPGDRILTRYFIGACDAFVAMSQSVLDELGQFTKTNKKLFLPHPLYEIFGEKINKLTARKMIGWEDNDKLVMFFGFVRKYKGLDLLLKAMADERLQKLNIKLVVAGEFYENAKEYLDMIINLGISDRVIIHSDFIPSEKVKYYFSACDMVAQTYHSATQSGVTQIAYNFNTPMLVTNVGGLSEIVPHNKVGYVCERIPGQIADCIYDFFVNNRAAEFAANIAIEKKRFEWSYFVDNLLSLNHD